MRLTHTVAGPGLVLVVCGISGSCDNSTNYYTIWNACSDEVNQLSPIKDIDSFDYTIGIKGTGRCSRIKRSEYLDVANKPPLILSIDPPTAPAGKALTLTISGLNFARGSEVSLCRHVASQVEYLSSEKLIATFPSLGETASCPVEVRNSSSLSGVRNDLFSFYSARLPELWGEPAVGGRPCGIRIADLDRDGFDDVLTVDSLAPAWATSYLFPPVYRPGTFSTHMLKDVAITDLSADRQTTSPRFADFVVGDFNEDGSIDVAMAHADLGELWVLLNRDNGTFFNHENWKHDFHGLISALAVADLNHDNHLDLIGANLSARHLIVWIGDGTGNFFQRPPIDLNVAPTGITLSDLNGDREYDAVLTGQDQSQAIWLLGNGRGEFAFNSDQSQEICMRASSLQVADLDLDKQPDWAIACPQDNSVEVLLGPMSSKRQRKVIPVPGQPSSILLADMDVDGLSDITIGAYTGRNIYLLKNQQAHPGEFSVPIVLQAAVEERGASPAFVATSDVNRDGLPDIIVGHRTVGGLAILLSRKGR